MNSTSTLERSDEATLEKINAELNQAINNRELSTVLLSHLFNFLQDCDQRNPDVLNSLQHVCKQLKETKDIYKESSEFNKFLNNFEEHFNNLNLLTKTYLRKYLSIINEGNYIIGDILTIVSEYHAPLECLIEFKSNAIVLSLQAVYMPEHALFNAIGAEDKKFSSGKRLEIVKSALETTRTNNTPANIPNVRDNSGQTPLTIAVSQGDDAMVKVLLEAGANIDQPEIEISDELEENGCGCFYKKAYMHSRTPLECAVRAEKFSAVMLLLSKGALFSNRYSLCSLKPWAFFSNGTKLEC